MKLGISMWSYYANWKRGEMDIPGFIHEAARLGVDGVELLNFFWKDRAAELPLVTAALAETGLPVGVYSVSNDFVHRDPADRAKQVDVIRKGVESAVLFGAKVVRVFAGNIKEGISFDEGFDWIVDGLRQAAGYAESHGVTLALENHGLFAGRDDQVLAILNAVDSPALKANPDTGNFVLVHEESHLAVAKLAHRAAMVHFKDFEIMPNEFLGFAYVSTQGLKFAGRALGEGDVDLEDCVVSLKGAGFNGWLNIEYEAEENPIEGVARSVKYARGLLTSVSA